MNISANRRVLLIVALLYGLPSIGLSLYRPSPLPALLGQLGSRWHPYFVLSVRSFQASSTDGEGSGARDGKGTTANPG